MSERASAQSWFSQADSFFQAGGTLGPDSPSYIMRYADQELLELALSGEYCNVLTSRQMGKSSLIVRTQNRLDDAGVSSAVVDLTIIGTQYVTPEEWYYSLISEISRELKLGTDENTWWMERSPLSPVQRFVEFLVQQVLKTIAGQIVVFIDEIDSTLALPFTDDFFAAIRALYNERASHPDYRRLAFVLVGVARPADLIKDHRLPPYNIGRTVDLGDFTPQDAKTLLPGLEAVYPDQSEVILDRVLYWTGGHPYLTQRVCAEAVSSGEYVWSGEMVDQLIEWLFFSEGQIRRETNLQWIDDYVHGSHSRAEMLRVYRDILSGKQVVDEQRSLEKSQLKLVGLVKTTMAGHLQVRNRIYRNVFGREWVEASMVGVAKRSVSLFQRLMRLLQPQE